ncbi:hypothetical protein AAZX31_08G104300 [Glycine max]|nr:hypothetical protein JHK85_021458 [Glycine max]KAG5025109.1 hypothetical protein JHK86_021023 [Glycine max]KAG5136279.1 hypothetical protein JHK82_021010 [Glycine max]KAH1236719.1 hypothetical protein GmHk_08G021859 [Glycine max]
MDNQDQRRTHTAGHESHGVHLCHKCGWPFPNPHPSAKHRRAHKKICGTIEGYKLSASEGQPHLNGSDDEHVSDDDHKTPGPKSLETGNKEKGNEGNGEKIIRSEDEVFSDAVADFSDSGSIPEIKERLQDSLDSGADVERVDIKETKFSGSSEDKDFNGGKIDASQLIDKSTDDSQIQNPNIFQNESVELGNMVELQGQLSGPTVDPLSSSIADLRTEVSTNVDSDVFFGLLSDSLPGKAEAMLDILPEKKIHAVENVTDCILISVAKETNLKEKDEINSAGDVIEIVESSDNVVGETCEGVSKIAVSDAISLDHQVGDGAVHLKENNGAEINSYRDVVEIVESSDKVVGEMSEEVSKIAVCDIVSLDHEVGDGAVHLKENNGAEFLSLLPPDNLPLELNSVVITNDAQGDSAYVVQFATSSDDKILPEKGEGNVNVDLLPTCDDISDEAHPQSEYGDFKDLEGVVYQNPFLQSSESLKYKGDDLKNNVTEENKFHFNANQLSEKSDILSPDMDVLDNSMKMELVNSEPTPKEVHAEQCTEVSPAQLTVESHQRSDETDASMKAMKTEKNEIHMVHFSEEHGPDDVCKNSQQISLPEDSLMASSNESQRDESFRSATSETTRAINIDSTSHHEEKITEINDVALDGKDVESNLENDIEIILKDLQPGDILQSEVKQSDDLFKSDSAGKSDAAGEMGKNEQCDIPDAQCMERPTVSDALLPKSATGHFESPAISESLDIVDDGPVNKSNGTECRNINPLPGSQKDIKEDEININIKLNEEYNKSVDTYTESRQAQDAGLLVKATEDLAREYTSLTTVPSAQPDREVSNAVPVQDQTGNNLGKLGSSRVDASVDSGSRCDSLEGNWGSVSVLSMQSDAPAVTDAETLPSTGLLASTGKSSLNNSKATPDRQQSGNSEMFEPPSFMTLVDPSQVSPKASASEVQKGQNTQHTDSTSQAAWFPTLTQVVNESQGRKKNEEIIAKVTNWSTSKEHTPLKSLLGEAAHSSKPRSPKMENSVNQKSGKVLEKNGSGLTTVNSILGPESPVAQVVKGEAAKEWNSPARYPADIKREKRKVKSRPYWIQLVCCTSVGPR